MGKLIDIVKQKFASECISSHEQHGDETVIVKKEKIREIMAWLKSDESTKFNFLIDLTAVDYSEYEGRGAPRFEVVYHLYSLSLNHRLRVKVGVDEKDCIVDSLVPVWIGADWYEREVWDMYGIKFDGHPNLKRLLLYEEFEGHPLRKDYPINKRQPLIGPEN